MLLVFLHLISCASHKQSLKKIYQRSLINQKRQQEDGFTQQQCTDMCTQNEESLILPSGSGCEEECAKADVLTCVGGIANNDEIFDEMKFMLINRNCLKADMASVCIKLCDQDEDCKSDCSNIIVPCINSKCPTEITTSCLEECSTASSCFDLCNKYSNELTNIPGSGCGDACLDPVIASCMGNIEDLENNKDDTISQINKCFSKEDQEGFTQQQCSDMCTQNEESLILPSGSGCEEECAKADVLTCVGGIANNDEIYDEMKFMFINRNCLNADMTSVCIKGCESEDEDCKSGCSNIIVPCINSRCPTELSMNCLEECSTASSCFDLCNKYSNELTNIPGSGCRDACLDPVIASCMGNIEDSENNKDTISQINKCFSKEDQEGFTKEECKNMCTQNEESLILPSGSGCEEECAKADVLSCVGGIANNDEIYDEMKFMLINRNCLNADMTSVCIKECDQEDFEACKSGCSNIIVPCINSRCPTELSMNCITECSTASSCFDLCNKYSNELTNIPGSGCGDACLDPVIASCMGNIEDLENNKDETISQINKCFSKEDQEGFTKEQCKNMCTQNEDSLILPSGSGCDEECAKADVLSCVGGIANNEMDDEIKFMLINHNCLKADMKDACVKLCKSDEENTEDYCSKSCSATVSCINTECSEDQNLDCILNCYSAYSSCMEMCESAEGLKLPSSGCSGACSDYKVYSCVLDVVDIPDEQEDEGEDDDAYKEIIDSINKKCFDDKKGLKTGAIIGIVFGVIAFVAIVVVVVVVVIRKKKARNNSSDEGEVEDKQENV